MAVLDLNRKIKLKRNKNLPSVYGGVTTVPLLGHAKNRIALVGVELEGGWAKVPDGVELQRDGSIHGLPPSVEHEQLQRAYERAQSPQESENLRRQIHRLKPQVGELPSPPLEVYKVPIWMEKYYPKYVNASCGLHVHMSFLTKLFYQRLITPDYQDTMVAYITEWAKEENLPSNHPLWPRLRGESEYCQLKYHPDEQLAKTKKEYDHFAKGHRYTAINYCFNMNKGTLECRLLPMMDTPEQGIRAVKRVIDITNACLVRKLREEKLRVEVEANDIPLYEEIVEHI